MPEADSGVEFRPLAFSDLPRLVGWFAQPAIARWWNQPATLDAVVAKYGPRVSNREATRMWIAVIETVPSGLLQSYRHADYPNHETAAGVPDAVGIDYLLDDDHRGRGLGALMLDEFAALVFSEYPDAVNCVATPAQTNAPSWRALERAGFVRRGTCDPPGEPAAFVYMRTRHE